MTVRTKIAIILLWLALCLPLLFLGYGSDFDAWRVAQSAANIWEHHFYTPARSLGNPLHEFFCAALVSRGGWIATNALSLLTGLAFILALFRLQQREHFRHPLLVVLATAFAPVFISNATSTMDYIPALALLTWAYVFMLESRWNLAALLLGAATGFRPTCILFLLPLLYYTQTITGHRGTTLRTAALASLWSILFYSPVFFADNFVFPTPVHRTLMVHFAVVGFNAARLLGIAQTGMILLIALHAMYKQKSAIWSTSFARFHLINIVSWIGLFIFLPDTPEYLLPALLSCIFLLDHLLSRPAFTLMVAVLLSYHFMQFDLRTINPVNLTLKPQFREGWSIEDIEDRRFKRSFRAAIDNARMDRPTVLMYGLPWATAVNREWRRDEQWHFYRRSESNLFLSQAITDSLSIRRLRDNGYRVIAWKSAQWENVQKGRNVWQEGIEVVEDIRVLFKEPITGRALNER